jgi:hypothetical protein
MANERFHGVFHSPVSFTKEEFLSLIENIFVVSHNSESLSTRLNLIVNAGWPGRGGYRISDPEVMFYVLSKLRAATLLEEALNFGIAAVGLVANRREKIYTELSFIHQDLIRSRNRLKLPFNINIINDWLDLLDRQVDFESNPCHNLALASQLSAGIDIDRSFEYLKKYNRVLRRMYVDDRGDGFNNGIDCDCELLMVVGPGKTGTTSLESWLKRSSSIVSYANKEISYFELFRHHGVHWYLENFIFESGFCCIDVSPSSFGNPHNVSSINSAVQGVKAISLLRDPVERVLSMIAHDCSNGVTNFDELQQDIINAADTDSSLESLNMFEILYGGRYEVFGRQWVIELGDSILFQKSEALSEDFSMRRISSFLGFSDCSHLGQMESLNRRRYDFSERIRPEFLEVLNSYYSPTVRWMREVL